MKSPILRTGFTWARGSWKIIATWFRYPRSAAPLSAMTSVPSKLICPLTCAPRGSSRSIARAVIDLPEPDSPTRPTASPGRMLSETSRSTARLLHNSLPRLRLLEEPLAEHVECDHYGDDARPGGKRRERIALRNSHLVLRDHHAPVRGRGLDAEAEERYRRQVDHRIAEQDRRLGDDQRHDVRHDVAQANGGG